MRQPDWSERLTHVIAGEIRHYRTERGMSAQQLSEACARLGLEISRSTLADLENGRRAAVTVAQMLILARALDVAPALLIAPVGRRDTVEIFPGQQLAPFDAARWLGGEAQLRETPDGLSAWEDPGRENDPLILFHLHRWQISEWRSAARSLIETADGKLVPVDSERLAESRRRVAAELRRTRAQMRRLGLTPPELPPELEHIAHGNGT